MHDDALVDYFIDDQNDATHIGDERLPLKLTPEDLVEALVDAVQHLPQHQFIIISQPQYVDRHVRVAPEHSGVVFHDHDVVLVDVRAGGLLA